jgi:hypothetical protein
MALVAGTSDHSVSPIYSIKSINEESVISNIHTHIGPIQDRGASGFHYPTTIPNDRYNATNLENRMKAKGTTVPKLYVYEVSTGQLFNYDSNKGDIFVGSYSLSKIKHLLNL